MYWYTGDDGIWRGDMDGSAGSLLIPKVHLSSLTLDHASELLFWLGPGFGTREIGLFYSDLNGNNVRQNDRLGSANGRIRVAGNRVWITSFSYRYLLQRRILSCDKETGDNVKTLELGKEPVTDFSIPISAAQVQTGKDVCILGSLCSHMCIPTPSGYMRCLCPTGYGLMEDGWTCGENHNQSARSHALLYEQHVGCFSQDATMLMCAMRPTRVNSRLNCVCHQLPQTPKKLLRESVQEVNFLALVNAWE